MRAIGMEGRKGLRMDFIDCSNCPICHWPIDPKDNTEPTMPIP